MAKKKSSRKTKVAPKKVVKESKAVRLNKLLAKKEHTVEQLANLLDTSDRSVQSMICRSTANIQRAHDGEKFWFFDADVIDLSFE